MTDAVRKSKQATLDILQRREANLDRAREQSLYVEAELDRIEQQAKLILDDAMLTRDPVMLSARIDDVAANLGETNEWISANADLLGAIDDTLGTAEDPAYIEAIAAEETETEWEAR